MIYSLIFSFLFSIATAGKAYGEEQHIDPSAAMKMKSEVSTKERHPSDMSEYYTDSKPRYRSPNQHDQNGWSIRGGEINGTYSR